MLAEARRRGLKIPRAALSPLQDPDDYQSPPEWFHEGQLEGWSKEEPTLLLLAGNQSGKTVFGPRWLRREMQRKGPGEYGAGGPTFPLMSRKLIPEYRRVFREGEFGSWVMSPNPIFSFNRQGLLRVFGRCDRPAVIYFVNLSDPENLESMTLKAFHADESGQSKVPIGSFEALERRLAIENGRICHTTTPYEWNALKSEIYDRWEAGDRSIAVVSFESRMNPVYPLERWLRALAKLPAWKFDMMYRGRFTRPAGMIYDCWDAGINTCKRFLIPVSWPRYHGQDFGNVNTAALYSALDPATGKAYVYRSYMGSGDPRGQTPTLTLGEPWYAEPRPPNARRPVVTGGAPSEDGFRSLYAEEGWFIERPSIADLELGIADVYSRIKSGQIVFFDDLHRALSEITTYSRKLNEKQEPTREIEKKQKAHRADALRYLSLGLPDMPEPKEASLNPFDEGVPKDPEGVVRLRL